MRCPMCDAELSPQDRFCGACGAPRPTLPPPFVQAERRFVSLRARYRSGELDDAAYDAALSELVIEDGRGRWMLGAESGAWHWYDGQAWVRRPPPTASSAAPRIPSPPRRRSSLGWWIGGALVVAFLCVAAAAAALLATPYGPLVQTSFLIVVDEPSADLYRRRAGLYAEMGDHERAAQDLGRAIDLDPQNPDLYLQRAMNLSALERYEGAIADLNAVTALDPNDCFALLLRGQYYEWSGYPDRARADYEQVLRFDDGMCFSKPEAQKALDALAAATRSQ